MKSVEMENPLDKIQVKEQKLHTDSLDIKNFMPKDIAQLQGLKKLKFVKMTDLTQRPMSQRSKAEDMPDNLHIITSYQDRMRSKALGDTGPRHLSVSSHLHHYVALDDDPTCRDITVLSTRTNMKYVP